MAALGTCHDPGDEKSIRGCEYSEQRAREIFPGAMCFPSCQVNPLLLQCAGGSLAGLMSWMSPFPPMKQVSLPKKRKGSSTAGSDRREVSCELQDPRAFLRELRKHLRKEEGAACSNAILINHIAKKGNQRKSFKLQMARLGN